MKRVLTVEQVALDLFGDARWKHRVYELIKADEIPHLRLGQRRIFVPRAGFEAWKKERGLGGAELAS